MAHLVPIASFSLSHEAHLVKAFLENKGIPVFVNDEFMGSEAYLAPTGGVKLLVPSDHVVQAKHALSQYKKEEIHYSCPHCSSTDTSTEHWQELSLFQKLQSVFGTRPIYRCNHCHTHFKP